MMKRNSFDRFMGPLLVICASTLGVVTLGQWTPPSVKKFIDGETQMALEDSFNNAVPIRDISVSGWNSLKYLFFGEMLDGGVAGTNGWLYTAEEYRQPEGADARLSRDVAELVDTVRTLADLGTIVTIALVPDKSRIIPEYTRHSRSEWIEARYDEIINGLRTEGISVVDLRPALEKIGQDSFLAQDTHWSAIGAKAAAEAIGSHIGLKSSSTFITAKTGALYYYGDLTKFVAAGKFAEMIGLGQIAIPEYTTTELTTNKDKAIALFEDKGPIPVALVGTSYSSVTHWNFLGALKEALGTDILNFSSEGRGPFVPMQQYLSKIDKRAAPDFLIWEVPERYLTVDP